MPKCIKYVHVVHLLVFLYLANATFLVAEAFRWIVPEKERQIEMCALYEIRRYIKHSTRNLYIRIYLNVPALRQRCHLTCNVNVHENIREMKKYTRRAR